MQTLVKTISTTIKNFVRTIKVSRFGKDDTVTGMEAMSYGDDSNPIAGMDAVYLELSSRKNKVIIGYVNKQQLAEVGEKRIYSTDANGNLQFYIWLHSDGTCEFNGKVNHLMQYEAMKVAFDILKTDLNTALVALSLPPSTADMSGSKLDDHLCP